MAYSQKELTELTRQLLQKYFSIYYQILQAYKIGDSSRKTYGTTIQVLGFPMEPLAKFLSENPKFLSLFMIKRIHMNNPSFSGYRFTVLSDPVWNSYVPDRSPPWLEIEPEYPNWKIRT